MPQKVQAAIVEYANTADFSSVVVIELGLIQFLDLDHQMLSREPKAVEDNSILADLPASIRTAGGQYALENAMSAAFVVELAIAHFLDPDSLAFDDCQVHQFLVCN